MHIERKHLEEAAAHVGIDKPMVEALWLTLEARQGGPTQRFDFLHVAYYAGALLVIGAMLFFVTLGWESLGGFGIAAISAAYASSFVAASRAAARRGLRVPAGLLATMAVWPRARPRPVAAKRSRSLS